MCEESKHRVGNRAQQRGNCKQVTRGNDVREIERGADERASDKTELDRDSEPTNLATREIPFTCKGGNNSGTAEPKRHAQQLGKRE